jgi:outer membrane protein
MKKITTSALIGLASIAAFASPAQAQDRTGEVQVKVLATAVLPDGEISEMPLQGILPDDTQTAANDNVVPTVAIEYFFSNNFSIETICCVTQHDVDGTTGLPGAELVSDAKVVPATFTAKYHFDLGGVKPYLGAGATYFLWFDEEPGAATIPLGVTSFDMSNEFGVVLQAGIDVPINDKGFSFSVDAKRYWVDTTATWFAGSDAAIQTVHDIDPWVISAGVGYRF